MITSTIHGNYVMPANLLPKIKREPSHSGLLELIRRAKDNGDIWADAALAEISFIMGIDYSFSWKKDRTRFEIESV